MVSCHIMIEIQNLYILLESKIKCHLDGFLPYNDCHEQHTRLTVACTMFNVQCSICNIHLIVRVCVCVCEGGVGIVKIWHLLNNPCIQVFRLARSHRRPTRVNANLVGLSTVFVIQTRYRKDTYLGFLSVYVYILMWSLMKSLVG